MWVHNTVEIFDCLHVLTGFCRRAYHRWSQERCSIFVDIWMQFEMLFTVWEVQRRNFITCLCWKLSKPVICILTIVPATVDGLGYCQKNPFWRIHTSSTVCNWWRTLNCAKRRITWETGQWLQLLPCIQDVRVLNASQIYLICVFTSLWTFR